MGWDLWADGGSLGFYGRGQGVTSGPSTLLCLLVFTPPLSFNADPAAVFFLWLHQRHLPSFFLHNRDHQSRNGELRLAAGTVAKNPGGAYASLHHLTGRLQGFWGQRNMAWEAEKVYGTCSKPWGHSLLDHTSAVIHSCPHPCPADHRWL